MTPEQAREISRELIAAKLTNDDIATRAAFLTLAGDQLLTGEQGVAPDPATWAVLGGVVRHAATLTALVATLQDVEPEHVIAVLAHLDERETPGQEG